LGATLTTATNILKEIYEPKIQDQLQNYNKASKRLEKSSEGITNKVGGKYVEFPIHVKRNHGIGARLENETLPTAQNQGYSQAHVRLAYLYGSIQLSGPSIELVNTDFQAFASILDEEVNGVQTDLAHDMNRQTFSTHVGALMTSTAAYAANTITTTNTQYMEVGMYVDIYASDATTLRAAGRNVTAVNPDTSIVVDGAAIATGASGDIVVRNGSINRETIGFAEIVNNTGTLYDVDPTVDTVWKSVMNNNGGTPRALSEGLMTKMADDVYKNGGDTPTVIWTTLGVRRAYANLLTQQRRFANTTEFTGGFKGLAFTTDNGEIPVMTDVDCQPNRMYFLNEKKLKIYRENDWSFMDRDGSKWQRVIGVDAYTATLYTYRQLGTHRRASHGLLSDITEG
jgi:hypothetical protein